MKPVWHGARVTTPLNQSLNLAVNTMADVLHTLYQQATLTNSTVTQTATSQPSSTLNIPEFPATQIPGNNNVYRYSIGYFLQEKISKNDELRVYALISIDFPFEQ